MADLVDSDGPHVVVLVAPRPARGGRPRRLDARLLGQLPHRRIGVGLADRAHAAEADVPPAGHVLPVGPAVGEDRSLDRVPDHDADGAVAQAGRPHLGPGHHPLHGAVLVDDLDHLDRFVGHAQ